LIQWNFKNIQDIAIGLIILISPASSAFLFKQNNLFVLFLQELNKVLNICLILFLNFHILQFDVLIINLYSSLQIIQFWLLSINPFEHVLQFLNKQG